MTGLGGGTRLGTAALAYLAVFPARHADFSIKTVSRLLKGDFHRIFEVGATIDLRATATASRATKYFTKYVTKRIAKPGTASHASSVGINTCVTVAVVRCPFAFIGQHFVGLFGLLEFFFGLLVTRVAIGVELHGQLAISLFQVFF